MAARPCSVSEALAASDHDPFLYRLTRDGSGPAWRDGDAVAVVRRDLEGTTRSLAVLGTPQRVAGLVTEVAPQLPQGTGVTVPRETPAYAAGRWHLDDPSDWDWRSTVHSPPRWPGEGRVRWLDGVDPGDVKELLAEANPESSTWPGDPKVRRWAGIRAGDGRLDACLADTTAGGQGHLSAISTRPEVRGQGLGSAITAWATRRLFGGGWDIVTLGVYAVNTAAQRTYDRLGFTLDHRFTSGVLAGGRHAEERDASREPRDCPAH